MLKGGNMRYTVDRIEEDFAVCEDENKNFLNIPLDKFLQRPRDGDTIEKTESGFVILGGITKQKKESVRARFERLKKEKSET